MPKALGLHARETAGPGRPRPATGRRRRGGWALAGLLLALAGCGGGSSTRGGLPVACVQPVLLADGADLTRYRAGAPHDLAGVEFDARLRGLNGDCRVARGDRGLLLNLTASFAVERGPAASGQTVSLPWFVAVVDKRDGSVLNRASFTEGVAFNRGETRSEIASTPIELLLPVTEGRRIADYRVLVSFGLTPEELAENRRRGPR